MNRIESTAGGSQRKKRSEAGALLLQIEHSAQKQRCWGKKLG
jgi:hypothetical protein